MALLFSGHKTVSFFTRALRSQLVAAIVVQSTFFARVLPSRMI